MKILVLADCESKSLYEYFTREKLAGVELILACGDLKQSYLDFFASMTSAPVLYVMGNHDDCWDPKAPCGCICIEDDIFVYQGIRILGLGGSMRYLPEAKNQYSEHEMRRRIRRLWWKLRKNGGFDILVSHAPAAGVNDLEDLPHRGFVCFCELLERYKPKLFVHGHVHANYGTGFKRTDQVGSTMVVNAYDYYILDFPMED
ncbi:metallophosphoesterase [Candidatus Ventrimonas sp. KK005]|mgnify:CR=1 FL=1|nr:metallophosphoesterase [Lachnospiraceae bacterium]NBH17986.1 metallophosphoesterase [Clostridiaceae bacterium]